MASDVTRDEFAHLTTRVDVVEREVEGEKMVTRHILEQTRRNSEDLAGLRTEMRQEFGTVRQEFRQDMTGLRADMTGLRAEMTSLRQDMTGLRGMVAGLTANLPTMIADVMRQVLRERGPKG